jgi:hypothetical protein
MNFFFQSRCIYIYIYSLNMHDIVILATLRQQKMVCHTKWEPTNNLNARGSTFRIFQNDVVMILCINIFNHANQLS